MKMISSMLRFNMFIDLHQQVDMDYDDKIEMTAAAQASDD